ncbi:hypothetical protein [Microbacterium hominis]|uniref:Uncharacterized protein n=1 Tax=Microbacterium hominis TaxID=162426 RepID=A0A7D4PVL3_9MICO|nr:hypothetical protein [Microbacterium hominis]QKJ19874.1 hypothetical protein HQM25_11240 [Microbacterium hominis]
MNPRQVRALRGSGAAAAATVIAATSHTFAGGGAPHPLLLLVIALLAAPVATLLAGRRLALWRVALTVGVSQGLFHAAFTFLHATPAAGASATAVSHSHHGPTATASLDTALSVIAPSPAMVLAHAVAAVLTVFALHSGERMLRGLVRGLRALLRPLVPVVAPVSPRAPRPRTPHRERAVSISFVFDLSGRGPPAALRAV